MKDDLYPFQLPLSVIISATVTFCRLGGAEEDERSLHHLGSWVLLFCCSNWHSSSFILSPS